MSPPWTCVVHEGQALRVPKTLWVFWTSSELRRGAEPMAGPGDGLAGHQGALDW